MSDPHGGDEDYGLLWLGLCAGEWTHQTFVRNKTDLNKCLIYFNGVNVKDYDDGHSSLLNSNTQPLTVGGGGNVSRIFPGSIDEVRVSTSRVRRTG